MTFRSIILGVAAGSLAISGAIAADLPSEGATPADYVTVSNTHGEGFFNVPGTDVSVKLTGEVRGRYNFAKSGSADAVGTFGGRGRFGVDGRRQTNFGTARAFIRASGDFPSGDVSFADAFGQLGGFVFGKASSFGNVTYGAYAMNVNHSGHASNYHVDNSGPMLGYSLDVGFGTNISVGVESPTGGAKLIPDIGAAIAVNQGWGSITVGGGAISHLSEGTKYDTTHPHYMALSPTDVAALDDPADLTSFGFYAGGGAEIPIPGLSSTKIGASGFFFSGALSKMAAFSSIDVYKRVAECTGAMCTQPTGAGRPLFKAGMEPATATHKMQIAGADTADDTSDDVYVATAAYLTHDDFDADTLQMETLFKNKDYKVGQPDEPAAMMGHINEIKQNSGFSANGGLTHSFSSDIALHVNGGFFSASEGDYGVSGFVAGGSFDYAPVPGTTFSLGGEFASRSVSFSGDEGPTKTHFDADAQSYDPSWGATLQVVQSF